MSLYFLCWSFLSHLFSQLIPLSLLDSAVEPTADKRRAHGRSLSRVEPPSFSPAARSDSSGFSELHGEDAGIDFPAQSRSPFMEDEMRAAAFEQKVRSDDLLSSPAGPHPRSLFQFPGSSDAWDSKNQDACSFHASESSDANANGNETFLQADCPPEIPSGSDDNLSVEALHHSPRAPQRLAIGDSNAYHLDAEYPEGTFDAEVPNPESGPSQPREN